MSTPTDVAVVQLVSWGDVVISSVIPYLVKKHHPGCRVTFYVSSACHGAIAGNRHVDEVVVLPATKDQSWVLMPQVTEEARAKHQYVVTPWPGLLDRSQWARLGREGKDYNFMWSYLRAAQKLLVETGVGLPEPDQFPIHLWPTEEEKRRAQGFLNVAGSHDLGAKFVMMETDGHSSQNYFNAAWTNKILEGLMDHFKQKVIVLISRGGVIPHEIREAMIRWPWHIHMLNEYSLREASVMFNACSVFIGGSSGTSNAAHGHQCKRDIKWFEAVNDRVWCSEPLVGPADKKIYTGADPDAFVKLIRDNL